MATVPTTVESNCRVLLFFNLNRRVPALLQSGATGLMASNGRLSLASLGLDFKRGAQRHLCIFVSASAVLLELSGESRALLCVQSLGGPSNGSPFLLFEAVAAGGWCRRWPPGAVQSSSRILEPQSGEPENPWASAAAPCVRCGGSRH